MYSVLLLMALSGNAEAPAWGGCHGCCGGYYDAYGCCGGYTYDCGGGWGCCGGYSCHGCHGGHHGHGCCGGGFFSGLGGHGCHGCHGCCGGSGYNCSGCCGGYGGYGCCGGGYGCCGGGYGGSGCCGGGWGCSGGCYGYYGGCCGGYGAGYGMPAGPGVVPAPAGPGAPGAPGTTPPGDLPKDKGKASIAAPASIVVNLPADARLMVDDTITTSTSEMRRFTSPELAPGQDYHYTLRAEILRDGQKLTAIERVTVRAGEETQVSLNGAKFTVSSVAAK